MKNVHTDILVHLWSVCTHLQIWCPRWFGFPHILV